MNIRSLVSAFSFVAYGKNYYLSMSAIHLAKKMMTTMWSSSVLLIAKIIQAQKISLNLKLFSLESSENSIRSMELNNYSAGCRNRRPVFSFIQFQKMYPDETDRKFRYKS